MDRDGTRLALTFADLRSSEHAGAGDGRIFSAKAAESVRRMTVLATVGKDGALRTSIPDFATVPVAAQADFRRLTNQVTDALDAAWVPLPNAIVALGHVWKAESHFEVALGQARRRGVAAATWRYVGRRTRAGRDEAVLEMTGTLREDGGPADAGTHLRGTVRGGAVIDLDAGYVTVARVEHAATLAGPVALPGGERTVPATWIADTLFRRGPVAGGVPADEPEVVLPNQRVRTPRPIR